MTKKYKTHKLKYNKKVRNTKKRTKQKHDKPPILFDTSKIHPASIKYIT